MRWHFGISNHGYYTRTFTFGRTRLKDESISERSVKLNDATAMIFVCMCVFESTSVHKFCIALLTQSPIQCITVDLS